MAYQLYSPAYHAAIQNGCIYVCLTGMDADMMVRTIGRTSYAPLQEMATRLYQLSQAAEIIRVTSPAGSDATMRVDKAGDPFWEPPPAEGGFPQMLGQCRAAGVQDITQQHANSVALIESGTADLDLAVSVCVHHDDLTEWRGGECREDGI